MTGIVAHIPFVQRVGLLAQGAQRGLAAAKLELASEVTWTAPLISILRAKRDVELSTGEDFLLQLGGWLSEDRPPPAMSKQLIASQATSSDGILMFDPDIQIGSLHISHASAQGWLQNLVFSGGGYTLGISLRMTDESFRWTLEEPRDLRANAFSAGHPIFFKVDDAWLIKSAERAE